MGSLTRVDDERHRDAGFHRDRRDHGGAGGDGGGLSVSMPCALYCLETLRDLCLTIMSKGLGRVGRAIEAVVTVFGYAASRPAMISRLQ